MSWQDVRGHYEEPDDEPEEKWPDVGKTYEFTVAFSPDGMSLVIEGPDEFWTFANDYGSMSDHAGYHFGDIMPKDFEPGVYRLQARFHLEPGRGEFGSHDPSADELWFEPIAYQPIPTLYPMSDWQPFPGAKV